MQYGHWVMPDSCSLMTRHRMVIWFVGETICGELWVTYFQSPVDRAGPRAMRTLVSC